jgi:hypothetical protein
MSFKDLLLKIANNARLTPSELDELGRYGTDTEIRNGFVAGNTTAANTLNVPFPFYPIFSEVLQKDTATLTVQIPSGYKHLMIMGSGRTTEAAYSTNVFVKFNGDAGANYRYVYHGAQASTSLGAQFTAQNSAQLGMFCGASATADAPGVFFAVVPHYAGGFFKVVLSSAGLHSYSATDMVKLDLATFWQNTSIIQDATLFPVTGSFLAGSVLSLYGIQ